MKDRSQYAVLLLRKAADTIEKRAVEYRNNGDMFDEISKKTNISVSDVFRVLIALKETRLESAHDHLDSIIDFIAYTALNSVDKYHLAAQKLISCPKEDIDSFVFFHNSKALYNGMIFVSQKHSTLNPLIANNLGDDKWVLIANNGHGQHFTATSAMAYEAKLGGVYYDKTL